MEIIKIKLPALRNGEHYQLMVGAAQDIKDANPETLNVAQLYPDFVDIVGKEDIALEAIPKSPLTQQVTDADEARDSAFRGFALAVETQSYNPDPAKVQAAYNIQVVIDHYGNIALKPYTEETTAINNLVQDINTRCADDVALLGIGEWITELNNTNKAFDDLMNRRFDKAAGQPHINLRETRKAADKIFSEIINRINASIIIYGEANYADFVNKLNERIGYFRNTLAKRKGHGKKEVKSV
jgi:hypothetical protein